jgi:hypothetical protein
MERNYIKIGTAFLQHFLAQKYYFILKNHLTNSNTCDIILTRLAR